MKTYFVYILMNKANSVLYIGVTNDVIRRVYEHRRGKSDSFTTKYRVFKLVYYESTNDVNSAIAREKKLKHWHRDWKINLIKSSNPQLRDLFDELTND